MSKNLIPTDLAEVIALHKQLFGGFTMELEEAPATAAPPEPAEPAADQLGEAGIRALQAEREAHKQAKKQLADLQAKIDAAEAEKLSDLEKAQKAAADAQAETAAAKREALRFRLAAAAGISTTPGKDGEPSDAELFLTGDTEEAMQAQADRLKARNADDARKQELDALTDPTQGGGQNVAPKVGAGVPRLAAAFESEMN